MGKAAKCCEDASYPNCFPVEIPQHDKFFAKHAQRCLNFVCSVARN